ncbi:murein biosynthesis integral membrane protein MurJ, partial [Bilophila wadsworthia]
MRLTATHKMGIAALIMAGSVFLSRLMGLVRDKVVSWQFGAGAESDVYFAAFVVPDFLNYLLAGGYISITLIPLLSKRFEEDEADGWRFFSAVFWWAALGIAALTAVAWIFAPELARIVGPGFSPEKQARLAHFLRIILPAQVFFLPGACVSALLYIRKQFLAPALTPLIYNGCIIAGGLLVTGRGMEGFCWGVLFGAALGSFLLPVVAARSSGSPLPEGIPAGLRLRFNLRHPLLKRLLLLALPLMLGVSIVAMDEQFVRIFGSMAGEGAVSLLSYARRIMLVPVGVVAQAAGVASFPFLAALAARGDDAGFDKTLGTALRGSMLVVIPLTAYMMAVALPTLGFIFEGGRFSAEETILTAPLLQILLLSVPFWVVQQVIGRAFYARQNTLTPAIVGTAATLAALPVYPLAVKLWGAFGVAMLTT